MPTNFKKRRLVFSFLILLATGGISPFLKAGEWEVPSDQGLNPAGTEQAVLQVQRFINGSQPFNLHYAVAQVQSLFNFYDSTSLSLSFQFRSIHGTIRPSCSWAVSGLQVGVAYSSRVAVIFPAHKLIVNDEGQIMGARVVAHDPACVVEVDWMY